MDKDDSSRKRKTTLSKTGGRLLLWTAMKLTEDAQRYYGQCCGERVKKIERWFKPELQRARSHPLGGGARGQAILKAIMKRWRRLVRARRKCWVEAYEEHGLRFQKPDVDDFVADLNSARQNVLACFLHYADGRGTSSRLDFEFEHINKQARQRLLFELTKAELNRKKTKKGKKVSKQKKTVIKTGAITNSSLQISEHDNIQNVSISINQGFDNAIGELKQHIQASSLKKWKRNEALDVLTGLPQLALEKDSPGIRERAQTGLNVLLKAVALTADLQTIGPPLLTVLFHYFGLQSPFQ